MKKAFEFLLNKEKVREKSWEKQTLEINCWTGESWLPVPADWKSVIWQPKKRVEKFKKAAAHALLEIAKVVWNISFWRKCVSVSLLSIYIARGRFFRKSSELNWRFLRVCPPPANSRLRKLGGKQCLQNQWWFLAKSDMNTKYSDQKHYN